MPKNKPNTKQSKVIKKPALNDRYINKIREELLAFFDLNHQLSFSIKDIFERLDVWDDQTEQVFVKLLQEFIQEKELEQLPDGNFQRNHNLIYITGKLEHVNKQFAFVVPFDKTPNQKDLWIAATELNGALDGDIVKAMIHNSFKKKKKPEGEIVEVVERSRTEFAGIIEIQPDGYAFVVPDARRLYENIFIPRTAVANAQNGQKVIAKIHKFASKSRKMEGEVVAVLGNAGDHETEIHAIMAEFGLPYHFSDELEEIANQISEKISEEEINRRRDFRNTLTFTIDPADAKDFDDALSIRLLPNQHYEIGVHIADVSHYVQPNTLLEAEAYRRATSVYLVDRTIPMLPEKLSNNLCSLRPNEDKLTFSAVFELNTKAEIVSEWFGKTIIHSHRRFSYEEAQTYLEIPIDEKADTATFLPENPNYALALHTLNHLAHSLKAERFKNGAIGFETVEVKFRLDEKGKPIELYQKIRKDAHKLIEEFMLLANKQVAEFVYNIEKGEPKRTMVYRIHERPDFDKLRTLSKFANKLGYGLQVDEANPSVSLNKFMSQVEGKPEQNVLESLAIRTMAKARYATEAIGHFGLAFKHYSHFTSPIRRYPDVLAHRLLLHYLNNGGNADPNLYEVACRHSSERERVATDAERASIKYKQVEYMSMLDNGQSFTGIITGVTEFGFFVEITETSCEGLVRLSDLADDSYELDQENYRLVGKYSGQIFAFGDTVQVRVKEANLSKRSLDLLLVGSIAGKKVPKSRRKNSKTDHKKNKAEKRRIR